jgi:hypothetical protein
VSRPKTYFHSNAGRNTRGAGSVPDVESLPCPSGGLHVLRNSAQRGGLVTACVGCGRSWSELDAEVRGS